MVLVALDHLIIATSDPDAAANEIVSTLGLRAVGGGRHEAHGTFNRLIWLGDSYIELMGVFDAELARQSWWGSHILQRLAGAPAAYAGLALASDDLPAEVERLRVMGSAISDPIPGERARPDGDIVRWRIARPPAPDPDLGRVFLIEHDTDAAEWRPADRHARAAEAHPLGTPGRLVSVELPVADMRATTMRLLRELGLQFRPSLAGRGARDTSIGQQTLRLAADGQPTIVVMAGVAERQLELLGCRWKLVPAIK
jgi:hypothetical protein